MNSIIDFKEYNEIDYFHRSAVLIDFPFPLFSWSMLRARCLRLASVESKYSVSVFTLYFLRIAFTFFKASLLSVSGAFGLN